SRSVQLCDDADRTLGSDRVHDRPTVGRTDMILSSTDLLALTPFYIVTLAMLGVMTGIICTRQHFVSATITVVGLNLALLSLIPVWFMTPVQVTPLFLIDGYSVFYMAMALISTLACSTLAQAFLDSF